MREISQFHQEARERGDHGNYVRAMQAAPPAMAEQHSAGGSSQVGGPESVRAMQSAPPAKVEQHSAGGSRQVGGPESAEEVVKASGPGKKSKDGTKEPGKDGKEMQQDFEYDLLKLVGVDENQEASQARVDLSAASSVGKCTDVPFLNLTVSENRRTGPLVDRVDSILQSMPDMEVVHVENAALDLLSHACEQRLRNLVERLVVISRHRAGAARSGGEGSECETVELLPGAHADLEQQESERCAAAATVSDVEGIAQKGTRRVARRGEEGVTLSDALFVLAEDRSSGTDRLLLRHAQRLDPALS